MSVHKIIKPDSPFEMFPRSTLQDHRLDCFELGALVRLCSLPAGWNFNAAHVENFLGVGKEKRQAIMRRFAELGYYRSGKRHVAPGDLDDRSGMKNRLGGWLYEHEFSALGDLFPSDPAGSKPQPDAIFSTAGNSGSGENENFQAEKSATSDRGNEPDSSSACFASAGDASAGRSGAIEKTEEQKTDSKENTPLPPTPAATDGRESGGDLTFPEALTAEMAEKIRELLAVRTDAQDFLDELAAGLAHPMPQHRIRHPVNWLEGVLKKDLRRTPAGLEISLARARQQQVAAAVQAAASFVEDPAAAAEGRALLDKLRARRA